ncbi:hypothetical protein FO519_007673 [Halicephalobus sp. NKZ332]|nr:hypothetical protein FO519_007673 [Halicephalobus sp. NKZ332]
MAPMEQILDLQAKLIRKVRVFPPSSTTSTKYGRKLAAVTSHYGFAVFVGPKNRVVTVKTADLHQLPSDPSNSECTEFPKREFDFFEPESSAEIFAVEFNSDGQVLAVAANTANGPFVYLFDGLTFSPGYTETPFPLTTVRLGSSDSAKLTAFEWNPCVPDSFAAGTTEQVYSVQFSLSNPSTFSIVGTRPIPTMCLSWSPKGKQITVGDSQGQIHQLRPEITLVRTIPAPQSLSIGSSFSSIGICWLSTTEWIVAFTNSSNRVALALVTVKKSQNPVWDEWSDYVYPLFDDAASLPRAFYFWPLFDWQTVLTGSSCYPDVWPFTNDGTTWKPGYLQEPDINCPSSKEGKACQIVGGIFDYSSTIEVPVANDGSKVPPQPIFYMMTTDGVVVLYHLVSMKRNPLTKPPSPINLMTAKNGQKPANFQPKNNGAQSQSQTNPPLSFSGFNLFGQKTPQVVTNQESLSLEKKVTEDEKKIEEAQKAEEIEKRKREELFKKQALEEEEKKKKETEAAKIKEEAMKEAQKQALMEKKKREYTDALRAAMNGLETYRRAVSEFHQRRLILEEGATDALEFNQRMEPYRKCIEAVRTISDSLAEDVQRNVLILKNLGSAAEEVTTILNSPPTESVTPDWVLELADNLDELDDRLFKATENYTGCMSKMQQVDQLLKSGKIKPSQNAVLSNTQQQTVERNSKSINSSIVTISKRIVELRKKTKDIKSSPKTKKVLEALKSAGGQQLDDSVLDDSLNTSMYNQEISNTFAGLYVKEREVGRETLGERKQKIDKIKKHLESKSKNPVKVIVPIPVTEVLKKKEKVIEKVIVTPEVQKARETLVENLKVSKELKFIPKKFPPPGAQIAQNVSDPIEKYKHIPGFDARFAGAGMRGVGENCHNIPISVPASTVSGATSIFSQTPVSASLTNPVSSGVTAPPSSMPTLNFGGSIFGSGVARTPNVLENEAKKKAEEEAKKKIEEEARKKAEEEAKKKTEEETKKKAEEEIKMKAEEEAKKKAEEEIKKKAEEEAKKKVEEETKKKAEEEAKKKAEEEEAKKKAEEEAKKKTEEAEMNKEDELTEQIGQLQSNSGGFGSAGFGNQSSNAFGSPFSQKSSFGSPGQTSAFGGGVSIGQPTGFGAVVQQDSNSQPKSSFGGFGTANSGAFGQQSASTFPSPFAQKSSFGSPAQNSSFGGGFSSFGNQSGGFGPVGQQDSNSQQKSSFGGFGNLEISLVALDLLVNKTRMPNKKVALQASEKSAFGSPTQNTSAFGSQNQTASAFGGGFSSFGNQSSGFGAANQDSNSQPKSSFGGGFGSGGFNQQSNTFASPFAQKSSFGSQNQAASTFGGGFSSFANKSGGFGAIAQQASTTPSQNSFGGFGPNNSNTFGQQKNAFNTWRS